MNDAFEVINVGTYHETFKRFTGIDNLNFENLMKHTKHYLTAGKVENFLKELTTLNKDIDRMKCSKKNKENLIERKRVLCCQ